MNKIIKYTVLFLIFFFVHISCTNHHSYTPEVIDGKINLQLLNLKENDSVSLKGNWKFKWGEDKKFFSLSTFDDSSWDTMTVPGTWNKSMGTGEGFGWYRLKILLPKDLKFNEDLKLGLELSEIFTSYELYVNGKKLGSNGLFGREKSASEPKLLPKLNHLLFDKNAKDAVIAIRISNFYHARGGIRHTPIIGIYDELMQNIWLNDAMDLIIFGILIMMIVYHIMIHLRMKNDKASLYFAVCCILVFFRILGANNYIERLFPEIDLFEIRYKIEYLSMALSLVFFSGFFYYLFKREFKKSIIFIIKGSGIILSIIILATGCLFYSRLNMVFYIIIVLTCFYILYSIILSIRKNGEGAVLILLGFVLFFFTIINDIFHSQSIIYTLNLSHFGLALMIFSQSAVITKRFSEAMKTVARNEQLEAELEIARSIKSKLLPNELPQLKGISIAVQYKPMDNIGGDFYDFSVVHNKLELFIADVSGHGLPSAFLSLITKMALDKIENRSKPDKVLSLINESIIKSTVKFNYVTCFFCILDPESKTLTFSNAGHFPPLLYRKESNEFFEINAKGIALGWIDNVTIEEGLIEIRRGDRIIFYTDGILECRNDCGEMFGFNRLKDILRDNKSDKIEDLSRNILNLLDEFCQSSDFDDDCTFIIVDIT